MSTSPNHLIHESSPYLLQHAYNPVDWHPWGAEALQKAKAGNKPILVSIGYAACHWCHVMEKESFEDPEIADYMNTHFVCIKVDREERPDIDQIYMSAVQLITGRGGWPLNCIALPDGRPFFGGTYFPRDRWLKFLKDITAYLRDHPELATQQGDQLVRGIQSGEMISDPEPEKIFQVGELDRAFQTWKSQIDFEKGGHRGAPKFPLPVAFEYLLYHYILSGDPQALQAVTVTLDQMARGGIYDQIGGGFSRYSVDADWKVPHFEKMLYDNAQLVMLYSHAYQVTGENSYERIVRQTLLFVAREMADPAGGYYSSIDADSEGVEGKFYLWDKAEIEEVLGEDAELICQYYQVTDTGNWEDRNILYRCEVDEEFAQKHGLTSAELQALVDQAHKKLLAARAERVRPAIDDKVLTSWNGLMMRAWAVAYRAFGEPEYLEAARRTAMFIQAKMKRQDGGLHRNFKQDRATINGFLDDYAFVIAGYLELYQASFEEIWLYEALRFSEYVLEHFHDPESDLLYYTSDLDPDLVVRKRELEDNVIPSSNSQMALNLFMLGHYFNRPDYLERANNMAHRISSEAFRIGPYYANWYFLLAWQVFPPFQVAITGPGWKSKRAGWDAMWQPFVFLYGGDEKQKLELLKNKYHRDKTLIYVCQDNVCLKPVEDISEAREQIHWSLPE